MNFQLSDRPIDPKALMAAFGEPGAGAVATFEGRVRNSSEGRAVRALDYEAYGPLAVKEGDRILEEARARFPILWSACVHRTGSLALGDIAVWVAVAAAHRAAAFDACRFIIDEAKLRVPIWKREHYADGSAQWVNCAPDGGGRPLKGP